LKNVNHDISQAERETRSSAAPLPFGDTEGAHFRNAPRKRKKRRNEDTREGEGRPKRDKNNNLGEKRDAARKIVVEE